MPSKEKVFYQSDNVIVSSTRLAVPSQAFAITSVSSVRHVVTRSSWGLSAFLFVLGMLIGATGLVGRNDVNSAVGLVLILAAVWRFGTRKNTHHVVLVVDSRETRALSSPNPHLIDAVILAVQEALEVRGTPSPRH